MPEIWIEQWTLAITAAYDKLSGQKEKMSDFFPNLLEKI